jgi:hypothetical protein
MQYKVLRDLVQIEPLPDNDAFDISDISYAKVIAKGENCSDNYQIGDIVGYIKKTAYVGQDICFIYDENVLMVRK